MTTKRRFCCGSLYHDPKHYSFNQSNDPTAGAVRKFRTMAAISHCWTASPSREYNPARQ